MDIASSIWAFSNETIGARKRTLRGVAPVEKAMMPFSKSFFMKVSTFSGTPPMGVKAIIAPRP